MEDADKNESIIKMFRQGLCAGECLMLKQRPELDFIGKILNLRERPFNDGNRWLKNYCKMRFKYGWY